MSPRFVLAPVLLLLAGLGACKRDEPRPPPATRPALSQAQPEPPPPAAKPEPLPPVAPKPGWSQLSLQDTLPICVFASFEEREKFASIRQIGKQTLAAHAPVVFGVFEPWCLNPACDENTLLQCWTERDGHTLTVHTRFGSFHKDGASCAEDCLEVAASCQTPALEPGTYTVRHGDRTYPLQIPSVVRKPCFGAPAHGGGTSK